MPEFAGVGALPWLLWPALAAVLVGVLALGLSSYGARRWAKAMRALRRSLDAGRIDQRPQAATKPATTATTATATRYHPRELDGLPVPVQRFFRAALSEGQPMLSAVSIDLAGRFNLSPTGERWKPFTSTQRITTRRPGFLWDARIALLPGVNVRVVDSYIAGRGLLHAAVQGLVTMARQQGDGDIASGELMRWFAEVAWYPTALLPSQGVRWQAVDEHSAIATLTDGPLVLSLLFRFDARSGLIESFRAEARGAMVGGELVMAPWEGRWSNYQRHQGMQLPHTGEVAWMRPEGRRPYFVGTITALNLEFAR